MANVKRGQPTQREAILAFVRARELCTTVEIRAAMGLELDRIGNVLTRLRFDGLVEREKIDGERAARWSAIWPEGDKWDNPKRIMVKEWTGHKRDELLTAFYGAAA